MIVQSTLTMLLDTFIKALVYLHSEFGPVVWGLALGYWVVINIVNFAEMGLDKRAAKKDKWRVPELRFFVIALLGGSLGGWIGMRVFHHKTKHWYFAFGLPAIFFLQMIILVAFLIYGIFFSPVSLVAIFVF